MRLHIISKDWCSMRVIVPLLLLLQTHSTTTKMDAQALSSEIAKFSAKFCNELDKSKSVVASPLSAEFVLALLTLGTSGDAHTELLSTLGLKDDDTIRSSFTSLSSRLKSIKGVTLDVANKVYLMEGPYELQEKMESDAVQVFDAGIEKVNFASSAAAANLINNWVKSKTNGKIKDLLSSDSLNSDTRLVLVNALYFKGFWSKKFNPLYTQPKDFYLDSSRTVKVPMMYKEEKYRYGESEPLNAQILELPYEGGEASMVIVLPKDIGGLNSVMEKLAAGHDLTADIAALFSTKVQVTLPKFKIETEIDLKPLLQKLGIKAIFNPGNSGIDNLLKTAEPLYVSKAVQKAFIEVNEEGAEAAAATAMAVMATCAMVDFSPVQTFVADRPFLVAILVENAPYFLATHRGPRE